MVGYPLAGYFHWATSLLISGKTALLHTAKLKKQIHNVIARLRSSRGNLERDYVSPTDESQ